ncbi:tyrosine-protein kinase receptor TYRO3 isoform X1 [Thunnus maccoyii]|uniref:tyrosine-protein kinase receptor TYRO3 isoform X1 n=2 Tax=Thunnus maccoyii TaxID=8240 RepID=UPI001C4C909D|nr:tyrosine-protein kinase receptor TYRO3 isoform X1 [Thunnus maccoyii]
MAVCNSILWAVWPTSILLWILIWEANCDVKYQAEEVEIFHSDKRTNLGWTSEPSKEWNEIPLRVGTESPRRVLQACGKKTRRTVLSQWMERKDARYLLMDIAFAQEVEQSGQLSPLKVYLLDSDTPITRFQNRLAVLDLQTSMPLPNTSSTNQISSYLNRSHALNLGSVSCRGFQLGFSYSGTCVLVTSIRLYYRRCPEIVADLTSFGRTGAGSEPLTGSCVEGAVVVSPPVRECNVDGVWGPLQGGCTCKPGHQAMNHTCQTCRMDHYKPANESGGCRLCPPNSRTHREGSERCDCLQGFSRLPKDPGDLGCTKPPSAPVNVKASHHNDSVLITWDSPHDLGGRQEVMYRVKCEKEAETGSQWGSCEDDVVFLPDSSGLTNTSVTITGLNPQSDYRLSVQAWNDISTLQGASPSSTATVTIHRWKIPPVVITVTPDMQISENEITPAPQHQRRFYIWLTICVLFGSLLLMAIVPIAVCVMRRNYSKLRSDQEVELLPMNSGITYRRQQPEPEAAPLQANGVVQLLEGISGRLLDSLKEVLVERNQLTLGKELGKGEFGSVYEGVFTPQEGMDIKVAVKTMRVGIHSQEDLHEFLSEAEIMKNFDHDNVVRLLGITLQREQDSTLPVPLVILPYMKHGDLRRFLIATRYGDIPMFVPHQSLLRFMIDIAAGMDYLSSQGFLHRDLAARNCMLGDDLRVCVADFGLSKKIYSNNYYRQKVAIRVPIKWMSIESLSESIYTTKSDVWSFGVTMWEIVTRGRTPYPGVHNHELLDLLVSGHRLKPPEDCDQKLYEVMRSCWDKEPTRRPGFRELGESLKGLLSELPVLEASQEASYINQGLEVAAATAAASQDPQTDSGGRWENVYLPTPVGAAAVRDEDVELEDGYLKHITGSAVKVDDNH